MNTTIAALINNLNKLDIVELDCDLETASYVVISDTHAVIGTLDNGEELVVCRFILEGSAVYTSMSYNSIQYSDFISMKVVKVEHVFE